jgi:hypothetical protein
MHFWPDAARERTTNRARDHGPFDEMAFASNLPRELLAKAHLFDFG